MAGIKFSSYEAIARKMAYLEERIMNQRVSGWELDRLDRERELTDGYESETDSESTDEEMPALVDCACVACMREYHATRDRLNSCMHA